MRSTSSIDNLHPTAKQECCNVPHLATEPATKATAPSTKCSPRAQVLTATEAATRQLLKAINEERQQGRTCHGIRLGISHSGCSGVSYFLEYVDATNLTTTDECILLQETANDQHDAADAKLFISNNALLFVIGTEVDFVEDQISSGFVFNNPNAKSKCGCQKSFSI